MASKKSYSTPAPSQPGGPNVMPPHSPQSCTASPRLGPAKPGGNPARRLNPYGGRK